MKSTISQKTLFFPMISYYKLPYAQETTDQSTLLTLLLGSKAEFTQKGMVKKYLHIFGINLKTMLYPSSGYN